MVSLPSRERGLKYHQSRRSMVAQAVAPFTGAWIEMVTESSHIGATTSLPSRERGLKSGQNNKS